MRPILSLNDLSARVRIPLPRLREVADAIRADYLSFYTVKFLRDKSNTAISRELTVPNAELKNIQRRIKQMLSQSPLSDGSHGGVQGKSPRSNAEMHLGKKYVVNLDVKKFFPHVRHYMVYRMFRTELGFGRDVARLLTRLTTIDGQLPQGAPTSTVVANLFLDRKLDRPVSDRARRLGNCYSRFVDDIAVSGSNPTPLIRMIARRLAAKRLPMHRGGAKSKLRITPNWRGQEVTGLSVNSVKGPSVARGKRDAIRAAIYELRGLKGEMRMNAISSIRGRIAHIRQFNLGSAERLSRQLDCTLAGLA